jgi:large repetitive protein
MNRRSLFTVVITITILFGCDEPVETDVTPPIVTITNPISGSTADGSIVIRVNATDNKEVEKVEFLIDGILVNTNDESPWEYLWNTNDYADGNQHSILVKATDPTGNIGTSSLVVVTIALLNTPPVITGLTASPSSTERGGISTITCTATDPEGDALTYSYTTTGGSISGTGSTVTYIAPLTDGTYSITCSISDGNGGEDNETVAVTVTTTNSPPEITGLIATPSSIQPGGISTITCTATDPDGDALTYSYTTAGGSISGTGSTVIFAAPGSDGSYTVICTISDGNGGEDNETVAVTVTTANSPPEITGLTATPSSIEPGGSSTITCTATDPNSDALTYSYTTTGGSISGTGSTVIYTAPGIDGSHTVTCTVSDGNGGEDNETVVVTVTTANSPPEITGLTASPSSIQPSGISTITCTATDPDGDALTYSYTTTGGSISGTGSTVTYIALGIGGPYTITCTVTDGNGGEDTEVVVITPNSPPQITGLTASPSSIEPGSISTITCTATDPDGDALTYSYSTTGGSISGTGSTATYTAPWTDGTHTITCSVTDRNGGEDAEAVVITANSPPQINGLTANPSYIEPGGSSSITCTATDPYGDALTYSYTTTGGSISGTGSTVTYTAPGTSETETITCTVNDGNGGEDTEVVNIDIFGTVTDIDGNLYYTIIIGDQEWMMENLRVTRYRNGATIPNVTDNTEWSALTTGAYRHYDNNSSNGDTYGVLYNWYSISHNTTIAPEGWHVPTNDEWQVLIDYLGGDAIAGGKMKETGTTHWVAPNTGATNESGFTALPGGYCGPYGDFSSMGWGGYFWSATEHVSTNAYDCRLYALDSEVSQSYFYKRAGYAVRCLRN